MHCKLGLGNCLPGINCPRLAGRGPRAIQSFKSKPTKPRQHKQAAYYQMLQQFLRPTTEALLSCPTWSGLKHIGDGAAVTSKQKCEAPRIEKLEIRSIYPTRASDRATGAIIHLYTLLLIRTTHHQRYILPTHQTPMRERDSKVTITRVCGSGEAKHRRLSPTIVRKPSPRWTTSRSTVKT